MSGLAFVMFPTQVYRVPCWIPMPNFVRIIYSGNTAKASKHLQTFHKHFKLISEL